MADWYVSTSGNDSTGDGSIGSPYATVSKAITSASAGDTIYVKRGDTFTLTNYVAINKSLTIDAYGTGANPIFQGNVSALTVPSNKSYGLLHVTAPNVTVKHIRLQHSYGHGIRVLNGSDNFSADDVYVYNVGQSGIHVRFLTEASITNTTIEQSNQNYLSGDSTGWGGSLHFQRVNGVFVDNCTLINNAGEGLSAYEGTNSVVFRNSKIIGQQAVGIYFNGVVDGEAYNNIVLGTTNTTYHRGASYVGPGISVANEGYMYEGGLSTSIYTRNIKIYNNLVAYTQQGINLGSSGYVPGNENIKIYHNTLVDNQYGIRLGGKCVAGNGCLFQNNIILALSGGTALTTGSDSNASFINNGWSSTPAAGFQSAGSVYSGIVLSKMTGWQSLSNINDVTIDDAIQDAGSTSRNAGSNSYSGYSYTADYNGQSIDSTPDLGPIQYGSTPVDPPASGSSITSLSAAIAASTADYTATGTELSGVYSAVIKTGATSEALTGVIGKADGTGFVFDTGSLTGIDTDSYTITATLDTPAYINFTPRSWTGTNITNTNNTTPYWIFDAAANITTTSGVRATIGTLTGVEVGDVLTIELFVVQDAATVAAFRVQNTGNAQAAAYLASPTSSSMVQSNNNLFSGTPTIAKVTEKGVTKFTITGTAAYASDYTFQLGSGNDPDPLVVLGLRVYKNLSPKTVDYTHTAITAPTISVVNADNVLIPNAENTITGTGLSQLKSITLSNAGGSITYPVVVGQGTTAKFRVADLTGLDNGSVTLTANYGQLLYESYAPASWANNTATAAVDYPTTILGMADAVTFASDGNINASLAVDNVFNMTAGQDIQTVFYTEQGTSGRLRAVLQNKTSGEYADSIGIFGALASTGTTMFSGTPTIAEHKVQNMTALTFDGTVASGGAVKIGVGPYTPTADQNVHVFGFKALAGPFSNITHSVTKASAGTPEPVLVKKIKFSADYDGSGMNRDSRIYNPDGSLRNTAIDVIVVYTDKPMYKDSSQIAPVAAYAENKTPVAGVLTLSEGDVVGSINALAANQVVWIDMWNNDGSFKQTRKLRVIAE